MVNSSRAIIMAADSGYFNHAKSLMVNCKLQGQWDYDFVLIVPKDTDASDFSERSIQVLESPSSDPFHQKFSIFSPYFKQWNEVLYLDCDILIQKPLEPLFGEVSNGRIIADQECFDLQHCFTFWIDEYNQKQKKFGKPRLASNPTLYRWVYENFGRSYLQYNTAVLLFQPSYISQRDYDNLAEIERKIRPINTHVVRGTDQPVINLAFYNRFSPVRNKLFFYWEHADDNSILVHYCSGYAPWIEKVEGMDAYSNEFLDEPCNVLYKRHLSLFDELFPLEKICH